ncbi:translation initiation factor eIF2 assembly protein [Schizosaccharomyces osmophilus]|uniref:Translation initiation factor eIF2 assembly protein n=1 Tax=Schizosaccharomyces osmophilus TaxID=2545709 RepID=A0AAF0ASZ2_9SCHI|nr:translation initiation factor eIF2 assembly protein [Schizosaccharomyces osmophilus]WBW71206.1 translation initiation factor eIF2 assembly protein [Schizosaccharomyces osmophilus]
MATPVTKQHILNCQFSNWYSLFRTLTPKAKVIKPIPTSILKYLDEDGIYLKNVSNTIEDVTDRENEEGREEEEEDTQVSSYYPDKSTIQLIERVISDLDGAVVPKLNWSSPKDAVWIMPTGSMKCTSAEDVLLILKSSDFVTHDLDYAFDDCIEEDNQEADSTSQRFPSDFSHELILKEWFPIHPSTEFRCFVKGKNLIAVCQRDDNYYDFLEHEMKEILPVLRDLTSKLSEFPDPNFVFDTYVQQNRAWLIDINPFFARTDGLLFSWEELYAMDYEKNSPEIRLIPKGAMPSSGGANFYTNRVPFDLVAASQGENLLEFAEKMQSLTSESTKDEV